jgi:hypothetical protein
MLQLAMSEARHRRGLGVVGQQRACTSPNYDPGHIDSPRVERQCSHWCGARNPTRDALWTPANSRKRPRDNSRRSGCSRNERTRSDDTADVD